MKSIGIRALKNQLSKYLALVRKGETVLVTDRDEVVAEIRQPSAWNLPNVEPGWAAIQRLASRGKVEPAVNRRRPDPHDAPDPPFKVSALELLDDVRGDR